MDEVDIVARTNADVTFVRNVTGWIRLYPGAHFRAQARKDVDSPVVYYQWSTRAGNSFKKSQFSVLNAPMEIVGTTSNSSFTVTTSSTSQLTPGASLSGTNIPAGSFISDILSATQFTFANATETAASGSGSVTLTVTEKILFARMPRSDALEVGEVSGFYDVILEDDSTGDAKAIFGGAFQLVQGVTV